MDILGRWVSSEDVLGISSIAFKTGNKTSKSKNIDFPLEISFPSKRNMSCLFPFQFRKEALTDWFEFFLTKVNPQTLFFYCNFINLCHVYQVAFLYLLYTVKYTQNNMWNMFERNRIGCLYFIIFKSFWVNQDCFCKWIFSLLLKINIFHAWIWLVDYIYLKECFFLGVVRKIKCFQWDFFVWNKFVRALFPIMLSIKMFVAHFN